MSGINFANVTDVVNDAAVISFYLEFAGPLKRDPDKPDGDGIANGNHWAQFKFDWNEAEKDRVGFMRGVRYVRGASYKMTDADTAASLAGFKALLEDSGNKYSRLYGDDTGVAEWVRAVIADNEEGDNK